ANIRDRMIRIEKLSVKQTVLLSHSKTIHVWAGEKNDSYVYVMVQQIIEGKLLYQQGFYLPLTEMEDLSVFMGQTLVRFYQDQDAFPEAIISESTFQETLIDFHNLESRTKKVELIFPQRGEKKDILERARINVKSALIKLKMAHTLGHLNTEKREDGILDSLKQLLKLPVYPQRIIGVDISHLGGTDIVGSAVYFLNGKPHKALYRQFIIKSVKQKSHDPESIYEGVLRRLQHALESGEPMPQLLVVDGGRGQLNFALKAVRSLNLESQLSVMALAKKKEEIYQYRKKAMMPGTDHSGVKLLQRIRDESHRFAVKLQRKQRVHHVNNTALSSIKGLGKTRINLLYQRYKTVVRMKQVPLSEMAKVGKMGNMIAKRVIESLK
ncbi:MAG: hypothetical protein HRT90_04830, partial [Candidatus Margulisbacteria bacterium]|nr:hypothetical protein [Candidatus Margulisiibacteriota bacterium]